MTLDILPNQQIKLTGEQLRRYPPTTYPSVGYWLMNKKRDYLTEILEKREKKEVSG